MESILFDGVKNSGQVIQLCTVAGQIWHEYFTSIIGEAQVNYMVDKFQSPHAITAQMKDGYEYFMLKIHDVEIGYLGIHTADNEIFLSKLYLQKSQRGKGYARQAMNFLERRCVEHRLSRIWLTVNRHNSSSIAVYQALGFSKVREQKTDIGNGYFMDDYVMEKKIS